MKNNKKETIYSKIKIKVSKNNKQKFLKLKKKNNFNVLLVRKNMRKSNKL